MIQNLSYTALRVRKPYTLNTRIGILTPKINHVKMFFTFDNLRAERTGNADMRKVPRHLPLMSIAA